MIRRKRLKEWIRTVLNYKPKYNKIINEKEYEDINYKYLNDSMVYFDQTECSIDDTTWHDLEMNSVYYKVNKTLTSPGEEILYNWLKNPSHDEASYSKRKNKIDLFKSDDIQLDDLRSKLNKVGYCSHDLREMLKEKRDEEKKKRLNPLLVLLPMVISVILSFLYSNAMTLTLTSIAVLGVIIYHYTFTIKNKNKIIMSNYILNILNFYNDHLDLVKEKVFSDYDTHEISKKLMPLNKYYNSYSRLEGLNPFLDIGDVITLKVVRKFSEVDDLLTDLTYDVENMLNLFGEIDSLQSIATDTLNKPEVISPEMSDDFKNIEGKNAKNILIDKATGNDINLDKSIVITGSNMSGKSTYLRVVGVNVLLAQGLCFVCADHFKAGFHKIISSISLNDDIESGKSYFMKEAEAIQRMLNQSDTKGNNLFLIDEIFKGTNPTERLAASVEILNDLAQRSHVIVTTHDVNILDDLKNYEFYHFEHNINKDEMVFDYTIKSGITTAKSALKLMEYINYPQSLIQSIYTRIENTKSAV